MSRQWIIIDDTDTSRIHYDGPWLTATPDNDINRLGNFGVPFKNSLHALNTNGTLSFPFNGTAVSMYGTTRIQRSSFDIDDPLYECLLDGASIPINRPLLFPENNWILCSSEGLSADKEHNITIKARAKQMPFYFDRAIYIPSNEEEYNASSWLRLEANHPSVSFDDSGWLNFRDIGNYTTTNNASVTISYFGRSLIFSGVVPGRFPNADTTAQYVVDDGKPTSFRLAGLPSPSSMEQFNQAFFQTPDIEQARHTVKVTYGGNNSTTPLTLNFVMVQRDPVITSDNRTGNPPDPIIHPIRKEGSTGLAGIVGGVIGGMLLTVFLVGLLMLLHRHRQKRRRKANYRALELDDGMLRPFDPFVEGEWDSSTGLHRPSVSSPGPTTSYAMSPATTPSVAPIPERSSSMVPGSLNQRTSYGDGRVFSVANADVPLCSSKSASSYPSEKKTRYQEETSPFLGGDPILGAASSSSALLVLHEDSGIRLAPSPQPEQREVIDVPPTYTPVGCGLDSGAMNHVPFCNSFVEGVLPIIMSPMNIFYDPFFKCGQNGNLST